MIWNTIKHIKMRLMKSISIRNMSLLRLILGLRHYLAAISKAELERIQENDPDFFFRMLP